VNAILVVGSIGYDTITTPKGQRTRIPGGSANYFSIAASLFKPVRVVGVVGEDYAHEHRAWLDERDVDLEGLQHVKGRTFAWEGEYGCDMNEAKTLATHLNVFENFHPKIPASYRDSELVFLANIDPVLQLQVLEQVKSPKLTAADTMNYWIKSKKSDLLKVLERIDILLVNEGELRQLTGEWNTIKATREILRMGPKAVVVKRGEYGFVLSSGEDFFIQPAFPIGDVMDPTGAGDTFAGGFLGHLAQLETAWTYKDLKAAALNGSLLASFTVQDFGTDGIRSVELPALRRRAGEFHAVVT
jgi:sugar/nucleoside kinase (ribokinase family)